MKDLLNKYANNFNARICDEAENCYKVSYEYKYGLLILTCSQEFFLIFLTFLFFLINRNRYIEMSTSQVEFITKA